MNSCNKYVLFIVGLLFFTLQVHPQNKVIDSLKNELLVHVEDDTTRVKILNSLAFKYYRKDSNKCIAPKLSRAFSPLIHKSFFARRIEGLCNLVMEK